MKSSILISLVIAFFLALGLFFYFVLKTNTTDRSNEAPYKALIGRTVHLKSDVALVRNLDEFAIKEKHFLGDTSNLFEGLSILTTLRAGTPILLKNAYHSKNGTSGITTSIVTGEVFVDSLNSNFAFEYIWGEYHWLCTSEPCDYWTFPKAIWQDKEDSLRYTFQ